jgi:hypothetical protein
MTAMTDPTDAATSGEALARELVGALGEGVEASREALFESFALRVFAHQFARNLPFRRLCERRGRTPETVRTWTEVPPVPVAAFKAMELACGDSGEAEAVFRTSGTTRTIRGRHFVPSLDLYRASLIPTFRAYVVPDVERIRFVSLIPSPAELPDSSLSHMVGVASERWASETQWAVGSDGTIRAEVISTALADAAERREPVLLLGTAFAFVHALERDPCPLRMLPEGSRIMETGGFKGRTRELPKAELYARLTERTGVPRTRIVNEYGMTELLSQLYEPVLVEGAPGVDRHRPPPWLAVRALDPETLSPLGPGEEGLLAFYDLANLGSVSHVLTEDLGSVSEGHVRLRGRVAGAEPRGCARAMDELMSAVSVRP